MRSRGGLRSLNRLWDVESWSNGTQTDGTTYIHDALDRVVQHTESHAMNASAKNRTTDFTYLGLSNVVTKETFQGNNKASDEKTYSYDAYNQRVSMVDDPSGTATAKTYTYGYDVHGSVSTLLDDATVKSKPRTVTTPTAGRIRSCLPVTTRTPTTR